MSSNQEKWLCPCLRVFWVQFSLADNEDEPANRDKLCTSSLFSPLMCRIQVSWGPPARIYGRRCLFLIYSLIYRLSILKPSETCLSRLTTYSTQSTVWQWYRCYDYFYHQQLSFCVFLLVCFFFF